MDWLDHCIPPRPFWESRGFRVFAKRGDGKFPDAVLNNLMNDNPRNSAEEQTLKTRIIKGIRDGSTDQELYAYQYDLRLEL